MARVPPLLLLGALLTSPECASGQLAGTTRVEMPPPVAVAHCTKKDGCHLQQANATLDGNWRWVHGVQCSGEGAYRQCYSSGNCYTSGVWDQNLCKDPKTCAEKCALEGVDSESYKNTYGVSPVPGGVELKFVSGSNIGSRLYLTDSEDTYKLFKLKNREFTFDVDLSTLPCGLNGAVYFSEMAVDGGKGGLNKAGAKFGTGYCDAQCPHDVKFMNGEANVLDWNSTTAFGRYGACCTEMDIWEANTQATAYTPHPCMNKGTMTCEGIKCGGMPGDRKSRYQGVCDKDGCDFNSYRMGDPKFIGEGPEYDVDTTKPITVVTQWLTTDGTDEGDLAEIRRVYVQDGKIIQNSKAGILKGDDVNDNSITDKFCSAQKERFGDPDDFSRKGGLRRMGQALDRGMVLVLSLWDDYLTKMTWLDSETTKRGHKTKPGDLRGPCATSSGKPQEVRGKYPGATARYTNFMYGEIGSTIAAGVGAKPENLAKDDKVFAARLRAWAAPAPPPGSVYAQPPAPAPAPAQAAYTGGAAPSAAPPSQAPAPLMVGVGTLPAYQQCGQGNGCQKGCTCVNRGGGYSQCVPPDGAYMCSMAPTYIVRKDSEGGPLPVEEGWPRRIGAPRALLWASVPVALALGALAVIRRRRSAGGPANVYNELMAGMAGMSVAEAEGVA